MNPVDKALSDLHFKIPKAILEKCFMKRKNLWNQFLSTTTVDDQILTLVIKPRVMSDCNIVGGIQDRIPLSGLGALYQDDKSTVVRIPKSRTQNRSILAVQHIAFYNYSQLSGLPYANPTGWQNGYNSADNSMSMLSGFSMMAALDKIPIVSTSSCRLIGENVIYTRDYLTSIDSAVLHCSVTNEENLNNISPRSHVHFSKLVEYAVKSYIYNELVIDIDVNEVVGGFSIGQFKSIIDGYSDAEQNYQDYLTNTWQKVAFMNDEYAMKKFVRMQLGGFR